MKELFSLRRACALGATLAIVLALSPSHARAAVIVNQGFNVQGQNVVQFIFGVDSAATPVGFYNGANPGINDNAGTTLRQGVIFGTNDTYSITFNAAAVFGPSVAAGLELLSATLFVDGINISNDTAIKLFVNGQDLGYIQDNGNTTFPTANGGTITVAGDDDNTSFTLTGSALTDLLSDTTYTIEFRRDTGAGAIGDFGTIDGVNVQATFIPEPASMLLFGATLLGALGCGWNRRRKAAVVA